MIQQAFSVLISGLLFWLLYSFFQSGELSFAALRAHSITALIFVIALGLVKTAMVLFRRKSK